MSHDTIIHFYPWPNFFYCIFFKLLKNLQLNYKINGVPAEFGVSIFLKLQLGTRSAWRAWWHSCNTKKAGWQNMAEAQLWDLTTALGNKSKLSDNIPTFNLINLYHYVGIQQIKKADDFKAISCKEFRSRNLIWVLSCKRYFSGKVKYGTWENIWPKIFTYFNIKISLRTIFYISEKMLWDDDTPTLMQKTHMPHSNIRIHTEYLTENVKFLKFISLKMQCVKRTQASLWKK